MEYMIDTFLLTVYLIRLHTENFHKYLYFRKEFTFIRTRYIQNQHLWCHFGDTPFQGNTTPSWSKNVDF